MWGEGEEDSLQSAIAERKIKKAEMGKNGATKGSKTGQQQMTEQRGSLSYDINTSISVL